MFTQPCVPITFWKGSHTNNHSYGLILVFIVVTGSSGNDADNAESVTILFYGGIYQELSGGGIQYKNMFVRFLV
jgi:hypothetical protein